MVTIRASGSSSPAALAGAIAGALREHKRVVVQAIGMSATNQVVKATVIARAYLESDGLDLILTPSFTDVEIDGAEHTAVRFTIQLGQIEELSEVG